MRWLVQMSAAPFAAAFFECADNCRECSSQMVPGRCDDCEPFYGLRNTICSAFQVHFHQNRKAIVFINYCSKYFGWNIVIKSNVYTRSLRRGGNLRRVRQQLCGMFRCWLQKKSKTTLQISPTISPSVLLNIVFLHPNLMIKLSKILILYEVRVDVTMGDVMMGTF